MTALTDSRDTIVDLAGMVLGVGHELGERLDRQLWVHHQRHAVQADHADGCEVFERIVGQLFQERID